MRNSLLILALIGQSFVFGQSANYDFERALTGVEDDWHSIQLPNEIFKKLNNDLSDLRIYGATEGDEEVEAAYIIQTQADEVTVEEIDFKVINTSQKDGGYYYTLQLDSDEIINEINIDFGLENFDWNIKLEGSQNQLEWFTIADAYRIMSIKNGGLYYIYKQIHFSDSQYRYYRIFVPSKIDPNFKRAQVTHTTLIAGKTRDFKITAQTITEDKEKKETIIEIKLDQLVPVHKIKIEADNGFDYYRPIRILCPSDSTKTEKGYIVNYYEQANGIFSSFEETEFNLGGIKTNALKIVISNSDNQPLNISNISISGYVHELVARFTEPAYYKLMYGNPNASSPNYDIGHFTESIPEILVPLSLGDEIKIAGPAETTDNSSFFENPIWLWGIMGVVIALLGFFTFKMLGSEKGKTQA